MVTICGCIYKSIQRSEFCKDLNMDFTWFVFLFLKNDNYWIRINVHILLIMLQWFLLYFLTLFLSRHIICTSMAFECRTLSAIFISFVDHWSSDLIVGLQQQQSLDVVLFCTFVPCDDREIHTLSFSFLSHWS